MKLKKLLEHDFIQEFQSVLVTEFEKELFRASLRNYCSHGNPLRFHNFAFAMRELVLHVIDRRAPNDKVVKASWYEVESEKFEVTRRQKLKFCAQGYLADAYLDVYDLEEVNDSIKEFLKKFNFFNKYTHITEKHFRPCPNKFYADMKYITQLSQEVIEEMALLENYVVNRVEGYIQDEIFDKVVNNFPDELSILASNVIIEETHPEKLEIVAIGEYKVVINVLGTVYVSQEYGKGEDFVAMSNNYPFTVTLDVSVSDPSDIGLDAEDIKVDTSSWFE
ncbi:hypothetical protein KO537_00765 [Shewanella sp. NKUCC01_JLK]|uniref:pPIWI-associating nuclease domain-containing protein n=1 Tax=Shewanella sp. NKUCC01_JLK TaxID=2842123 RepID=UPI001C5AFF25|nr:hypothetical protein [Shewanella sp. NKUCC01_JLK]MBW3513260.1 hypothetical protein [Shewanella sp. NKUCC01_JLK]